MRNFDSVLDQAGTARLVIREEIKVTPTAPARGPVSRTDLLASPTSWTWKQLRDYTVTQIEQRFGRVDLDPVRLASIFKSFQARHGERSAAIAIHAFENLDGYWLNQPVTVFRFCKGSDPFFADAIIEQLGQ